MEIKIRTKRDIKSVNRTDHYYETISFKDSELIEMIEEKIDKGKLEGLEIISVNIDKD
jgi:hypothetical protein